MLARRYRLTKKDHVPAVLKEGKMQRGPHFVIRFRENRRTHPRFSVIVSRKIRDKAVERNRLRRQMYESIRLYIKANPTLPPLDLIVLPKKGLLPLPYATLSSSLQCLLNKIFKGSR